MVEGRIVIRDACGCSMERACGILFGTVGRGGLLLHDEF